VDGAIRSAAGPALEAECLALPTLPKEEVRRVRRDITRWTSGVKEGNSAPVRCPTGASVVTSAPGDLDAAHLIHAVAPDSEFGYEGLYTGALRDEEVSNVHQDSPAANLGRHPSWLQFSPPDQLLFGAWHSALGTAAALGAASVAAPLLGAGVKGWRPTTATALGLEALVQLLLAGRAPQELHLTVGGEPQIALKAWRAAVGTARTLLGAPPGLEEVPAWAEARESGEELAWEVEAEALLAATARRTGSAEEAAGAVDAAGSVLPLLEVADVAEMHKNRAIGYSGTEVPLTAEQELRNAKTGAARATATAIASSLIVTITPEPPAPPAQATGEMRCCNLTRT